MTQRNQINLKAASFLAPIWKNSRCVVWGVITAKIKFAILLCCLPMRFLILFRMLQIVFNMFSLMFAKMSLLFCCFCILLFGTNNVCVVPCGVMRNLDAIIRGSNYVRPNPGVQRARSLWSGASDKLIMAILPAERKFIQPSQSCEIGWSC